MKGTWVGAFAVLVFVSSVGYFVSLPLPPTQNSAQIATVAVGGADGHIAQSTPANLAEGTDKTCEAASTKQDYRSGKPPGQYCADQNPSPSPSCSSYSGANPVASLSPQSQVAGATVASCQNPRINLCGKTCTYQVTPAGGASFTVTGRCVAQDRCHGVSFTDKTGTHNLDTAASNVSTPAVPAAPTTPSTGGAPISSSPTTNPQPQPTSPAPTQPTTPSAGGAPVSSSPVTPSPTSGGSVPVSTAPTANSGISTIANGGTPVSSPGSTLPSSGAAPVSTAPVTPSGPAFQSPAYALTPPPAGTAPAGSPQAPASAPYGQTAPNMWTAGYNSSRYSGGSSPVSVATNQSGAALFFNGMLSLFGGLISSGSSGSGGSYSYTPAQASAQKTPVQRIVQLYVIGAPAGATAGSAKPASTTIPNVPGVTSYGITIPETPPVYLSGTVTTFPSLGSFQNLFALIESHSPSGTAYGAPSVSLTSSKPDESGQAVGATGSSTVSGPTIALQNQYVVSAGSESTRQSSSTPREDDVNPITFVQPYAVSATAPAGSNGFFSALNSIDGYAGGWTGGKIKDPRQALLENRAALAQLQSNYEGAQAALSAWQALVGAGLCAENCRATIAALQSQLPDQEAQMKKLSDAVFRGTDALSRTPVIDSGISGLARNPEHAALLLSTVGGSQQTAWYGSADIITNDNSSPTTTVRTVARYDLPPVSTSTEGGGPSLVEGEIHSGNSSTGLPELLARVWSALTSWLSPSTSSAPSGIGCSLLGSLFGFCKGS